MNETSKRPLAPSFTAFIPVQPNTIPMIVVSGAGGSHSDGVINYPIDFSGFYLPLSPAQTGPCSVRVPSHPFVAARPVIT